jgi:hypothetical protein
MEKPMAADERELNFDKALGRHLRSNAATNQSAPVPAGFAAHSAACPDAETLAAYHERSLLPEEMNSWKEHLVGCAHCQSILAQLEATDSIALQTLDEAQVAAEKTATPVLTARSLEPIPATSAPKKSRRVLLLRGARWKWLAPAGAIAAGLLVYIALHENQRVSLQKEAGTEMASRQPLPSPAPSISGAVPEPAPLQEVVRVPPQSPANEYVSSNARAAMKTMPPTPKLADQTQPSVSKPSVGKEDGLRKDAELKRAADLLQSENQLDRDAKSAPAAKQESADVQLRAQTQAVEVQSQNQNVQNIQNAPKPGPSQMGQAGMAGTKRMKSAAPAAAPAPPPPAATGGAVASYGDTTSTALMTVISDPRLIAPPASSFLWRAGRAGTIDFSRDAGSSWSHQSSGVLVDLFTGSAPSDNVCWMVGRLGTVLLTTDGGAHWKLLSSPTKDDLGGIHALDALHARLWNLRNTKIFETTDGGLSWKSLSNP